ncbi:MAG: hypothetical protein R2733_13425 [Acidimicrobiales bacterium]
MNEHDPFEVLRSHKPFSADTAITDTTQEAKAALFEEITMTEHTPEAERRARKLANAPSRWQRPTLAAAAATVAAVGVLSTTLNNPSAYASVIEATEVVAEADSGRVRVDVDVREDSSGGSTESGSFFVDVTYTGNDSLIVTGGAFDGDQQAGLDDYEMSIIQVDGTSYLSNPDGTWAAIPGSDSMSEGFLPGLGAADTDPTEMLELLRTAEDVSKASNNDGTTTYVGTITAASVEALDPDRLPAGIAMIAEDPGNLPPEMGLTVTVENGALRSVRLDAIGDYPGSDLTSPGYIDATITTTYSDVGSVDPIETPAPELIVESPFADESMMEAVTIVGDFLEANPGFCGLDSEETYDPAMPEDVETFVEELSACFDEQAPPDVAAAWRIMNEPLLGD